MSTKADTYLWTEKNALGEEIRLVPAPVLHRMVAWAIDLALVLLLQTILAFFMASENLTRAAAVTEVQELEAATKIAFFLLLNYFLQVGYYVYFEYFKAGRTVGKRLLSLRVVSHTGGRPLLQAVLWRCLLRPLEAGFLPFIAGFTALLREDNRRIGDILGGTLVVIDLVATSPGSLRAAQELSPAQEELISHMVHTMPKAKLQALRELAKIYGGLTAQQRQHFATQVTAWFPATAREIPLKEILARI